jgi:hypothetical protein
MSAPMLPPPLAWLRQSGWGRDVSSWAREEDRQFTDDEVVWAMTKEDDEPIKAIVSLARFRRILGNAGSSALEQMAALPPEEGAALYYGHSHEQIVAIALASWIENGERLVSFGPDLSASFLDDPEADPDVSSILTGGDAFYVRFEGVDVPSFDGRPLDGFMIMGFDVGDGPVAEIVPFSRSPITLSQPQSLRPTLSLDSDSAAAKLSDAFRADADVNEADLPSIRSKVAERPEATTYSQRQRAMIAGMNPASDLAGATELAMLEQQIGRMRENADSWARLIGGALRTIALQRPAALAAYPAEAPTHLVAAALTDGRQSQRAVKKLRSEGWPRMLRHEIGVEAPSTPAQKPEAETETASDIEPVGTSVRAPTASERSADQHARRLRRRQKRADHLAEEQTRRSEAAAAKVAAWKKNPPQREAASTSTIPSVAAAETNQEADGQLPLPIPVLTTTDEDHSSWEAVSRSCGSLDQKSEETITRVLSVNAVTRTVARALRDGGMPAEACSAVSRQFASMAAAGDAFVDSLTSPDISGDADLSPVADRDGALVVSDRALFEYASPGRIGPFEPMRETALCVLYRIRRTGMDALIVQVDSEARLNLLQWTSLPLAPTPEDDDLSWYLRGAVALVAEGAMRPEPVAAPTAVRLLPAVQAAKPRPDVGEPPRRAVAQVRIRPDDLSIAQQVASRWFDAQVQRHGDMLVADRRQDGEWTIEHRSEIGPDRARWSVTLRVCREQPTLLDIIVRTTLASGVKPRLPTLIREIAEATPTEGLDGYLETSPPIVRDRADVTELMRELQDPERDLPILLMTPDREGRWLGDPVSIARQALGAITVRMVDSESTYDLTDALGQEYRTFGGAVRLFQPRFDPDNDLAARHPRIMPGSGAERVLADVITRATAMTVTRYPIQETETVAAPSPVPAPVPAPAPAPLPAPVMLPATPSPVAIAPVAARTQPAPPARPAAERKPAAIPVETAPDKAPESKSAETAIGTDPREEVVGTQSTPDATAQGFMDKAVIARLDAAGGQRAADPDPKAEPEPASDDGEARPLEVEEPLPLDMPEQPKEHVPPAVPVPPVPSPVPFDQDDLDRRIAASVREAFAQTGVPDLVAAIGALVGRFDTMVSAGAMPFQMPVATASDSAELARRDETIIGLREELRADRETAENLLSETDARRMAAEDEVAVLRAALNDRRRESERRSVVASAPTFPSELSGLADWLKDNVLPNVVVTSKAYRGMRKVRYVEMERLCKTLQLLDGAYVDMRSGIAGARDRWLDGLKTLRLDNKKQSEGGKSIRGGAEYRFTHDGDTWEMDWHIRGIESLHNEPERLLRIYFAYDEAKGRVLIGHMPTHLTTVDS